MHHKATIIETVWYWHKDIHSDQWNIIENPEINPPTYDQMISNKDAKTIKWERAVFSANGATQPNAENEVVAFLTSSYTKIKTDQKVNCKS